MSLHISAHTDAAENKCANMAPISNHNSEGSNQDVFHSDMCSSCLTKEVNKKVKILYNSFHAIIVPLSTKCEILATSAAQ